MWYTQLISVVVSTFTTLLAGIGTGIVELFDTLILQSDGTTVTTFALYAFMLIGLGLGIKFAYWIISLVRR
ncbi:MAG: hypothetical protein FWE36_08900 [Erysipelotrichales bacterium]|nr:hypothetical protein [Erysipelotrichales bacterium]